MRAPRPLLLLIAVCVTCAAERAGEVLNQAGQMQAEGRYEAALRLYDEVVRIDPLQPAGPYGRGLALRALGRGSEAIAAFRESTRVDPGFVVAYLELGRTQESEGMRDAAIATLREAALRFPGHEQIESELRFLTLLRLAPTPTPTPTPATAR